MSEIAGYNRTTPVAAILVLFILLVIIAEVFSFGW